MESCLYETDKLSLASGFKAVISADRIFRFRIQILFRSYRSDILKKVYKKIHDRYRKSECHYDGTAP